MTQAENRLFADERQRTAVAFLEQSVTYYRHLGRTFVGDGNGYVNRPGPRIADSAQTVMSCMSNPPRLIVLDEISPPPDATCRSRCNARRYR